MNIKKVMDLKNLSGAASGLGDKIPKMGGQDSGLMLGKLFSDTGHQVSSEEFAKIQECAEMLEKYVSKFPKKSGTVRFDEQDMKRWKTTF